ncbi:hypothetical protein CCP4SC76_7480004 [Gammaproteobacteria bacterium]
MKDEHESKEMKDEHESKESADERLFLEVDKELLDRLGIDELRNREYFGVLDRLERAGLL